jgi:hypothetical protein
MDEIYKIIHIHTWLHHSDNCRHFGFLKNLKKGAALLHTSLPGKGKGGPRAKAAGNPTREPDGNVMRTRWNSLETLWELRLARSALCSFVATVGPAWPSSASQAHRFANPAAAFHPASYGEQAKNKQPNNTK